MDKSARLIGLPVVFGESVTLSGSEESLGLTGLVKAINLQKRRDSSQLRCSE